ncbi:MAG TPA: zf-HC2 domain-containing protein [Bacteroidota bacterium]|nr:zf-HC2 domain-containing protein [Bacteroidota bacterium]
MKSNHVSEELLAYLSENLDGLIRQRVESHLENCPQCRTELESIRTLWNGLGELPAEPQPESSRERFYEMLRGYKQGISEQRRPAKVEGFSWGQLFGMRPAMQFGAALALVALGWFFGSHGRFEPNDGAQLAQLQDEMHGMSRMLTMSLLKEQSASARLEGVSWSYKTPEQDPEIETALVQTVKFDKNVNVRLAALDAISRMLDQPEIRSELIQDLPKQSSPLVQLAMVDLLVQAKEKESVAVFTKMLVDTSVNDIVKKKIQEGMVELKGAPQPK